MGEANGLSLLIMKHFKGAITFKATAHLHTSSTPMVSKYGCLLVHRRITTDLSLCQYFRPGFAIGVQIRRFSNSNSTVASPLSNTIVVKSGAMKEAAVIPDGCDLVSFKLRLSFEIS